MKVQVVEGVHEDLKLLSQITSFCLFHFPCICEWIHLLRLFPTYQEKKLPSLLQKNLVKWWYRKVHPLQSEQWAQVEWSLQKHVHQCSLWKIRMFYVRIRIRHTSAINETWNRGLGIVDDDFTDNRTVEGNIMIAQNELNLWNVIASSLSDDGKKWHTIGQLLLWNSNFLLVHAASTLRTKTTVTHPYILKIAECTGGLREALYFV